MKTRNYKQEAGLIGITPEEKWNRLKNPQSLSDYELSLSDYELSQFTEGRAILHEINNRLNIDCDVFAKKIGESAASRICKIAEMLLNHK